MSSSRSTGFPAYSQVCFSVIANQESQLTYDFAPLAGLTVAPTEVGFSGATNSLDMTGGVYKTRERIHRGIADPRLLAIPAS